MICIMPKDIDNGAAKGRKCLKKYGIVMDNTVINKAALMQTAKEGFAKSIKPAGRMLMLLSA